MPRAHPGSNMSFISNRQKHLITEKLYLTPLFDAVDPPDLGDAFVLLSEHGVRVHFHIFYRSTTCYLKLVEPDMFGIPNLGMWKCHLVHVSYQVVAPARSGAASLQEKTGMFLQKDE